MRADTSQNLTMDWDTVYAIPYRAVNEAIAASGSSPKSFSQPENDGEVVVSGDFGPWQLATGGSGKDIHLSIPILKGSVTSKGGEPVEFENITAEVEVRALYLPNPQTGLMDLRLQTSNEEGNPAASVQQLDPEPSNSVVQIVLPVALQSWLCANLMQFDYTFASVDLNLKADHKQFQWLTPTKTSYAVAEPKDSPTVDNCAFGVLSMTENRDNPNLSHELSTDAIPKGADAGFLIATSRFLEKLVLAGLPALFRGKPSLDSFTLSNDGTQIANNVKLHFQKLKLKDGTIVKPSVEKGGFTVSVDKNLLEIGLEDYHYFYTGANVTSNYTLKSTVYLDDNLSFNLKSVTATASGSASVPKSDKWLEIATTIALTIAMTLLGWELGGETEEIVEGEIGGVTAEADGTADVDPIEVKPKPDANPQKVAEEESQEADTSSDEVKDDVDGADKPTKSDGWFKRNKVKIRSAILGSVAAGVSSAVLDMMPSILAAIATGKANEILRITNFSDAAVKPIQWSDRKDFKLTSVALNGCLQMGGTPSAIEAAAKHEQQG